MSSLARNSRGRLTMLDFNRGPPPFTPSEAAARTYQMPQCWITLLLPVSLRSLATPAPSGPARAGHLSGWGRRLSRASMRARSICLGVAQAPNVEGEKQARLSAQENANHE